MVLDLEQVVRDTRTRQSISTQPVPVQILAGILMRTQSLRSNLQLWSQIWIRSDSSGRDSVLSQEGQLSARGHAIGRLAQGLHDPGNAECSGVKCLQSGFWEVLYVQWGSENQTCPVFEWSKVSWFSNSPVFKCHSKTGQKCQLSNGRPFKTDLQNSVLNDSGFRRIGFWIPTVQ